MKMLENKILYISILSLVFPLVLASQVDYSSEIQPIFNVVCINCHGTSGGLSLTSFDNLMVGGNHGDVVTPFDADNSILVQKLQPDPPFGSRMPKNNQTYFDSHPEELQLIIDWINDGASEFVSVAYGVELPNVTSLINCYPNPFNPSTTIRFSIEMTDAILSTDHTTEAFIQIYDINGRLVDTLVKDKLSVPSGGEQGVYEVVWDASSYPSGIYLVRLHTNGWSSTAMLTLLNEVS